MVGATGEDGEDRTFLTSGQQPVVDFQRVRDDLQRFEEYNRKIASLRPGDIRGALHIDSRHL
jgi:hypothetical protein